MPNPFASPLALPIPKRPARRARFEVGIEERHVVEIFMSTWGTEVYAVDGNEVLRQKSFSIWGARRFDVGDVEKHSVEIRIDMFPSWKSLIAPVWIAEAYVDGVLVVADLFPDIRKRLRAINRIRSIVLAICFCVLTSLVGFLVIVSWLAMLAP